MHVVMKGRDYDTWLAENRKLAAAGDEAAKNRVATADTLVQSALRDQTLKQQYDISAPEPPTTADIEDMCST